VITLETPSPVRAVFTTRDEPGDLGATSGANDAATVRANRRDLCATLGVDADRVVMGHQVHGAIARRVDTPTRPGRFTGALAGWPEGDALTTSTRGMALVALGADCLPVLFWRRDGSAVGAAHAGWRGLVEGVLEETVTALGPAEQLAAAIGPGIGPCCYVTGADVRERFSQRFGPAAVRGDAVDLAGSARIALGRAGVDKGAITTIAECTSCREDRYFSYRRDGARTGRQAGVIWIDA
jgi:polyphenol oxidase